MFRLLCMFVVSAALFSFAAYAQDTTCPCCTPMHHQFDFWIGEWEVTDTSGRHVGNSSIKSLENHCIISEYWQGRGGGTGRSYNYFDSSDSTWHQLWLSSNGFILRLQGTATDSTMTLTSSKVDDPKGSYKNRITWILHSDGTVHQHWELITLHNKPIRTIFYGIYTRKE